jgi:hypothetical protein
MARLRLPDLASMLEQAVFAQNAELGGLAQARAQARA